MSLNIAVIAGDGTGPEVIAQALHALEAAAQQHGFDYRTTDFNLGAERYLDTGSVLDDDELDRLRQHDAILLGAVGHPDVKPGILERGLLLKMRFDLDQYINLRPVKLYPGIQTPLANKTAEDIDFIVVRENTEDLYCGNGGTARKGTPHEISTQEMIATAFGVQRCLRYAFETALSRPRKKLTLVHKTNVLTYCGDTWFRLFHQIGEAEYPGVEREYHHVDACCMYMVTRPESYDVIVVPNMFGDIITDLGAAIAGGMGIAASGNLHPCAMSNVQDASDPSAIRLPPSTIAPGGPSMFEPVHGSSPDIAGQNKANPLAAIESLAMLLEETGRSQAQGQEVHNDAAKWIAAGQAVHAAVRKVTPRFAGKTLDRSGYGTDEIGKMVIEALGQ